MTGGGHTEIYGSGTTPKTSDSQRMILVKILTASTSGGGVGGSGAVYTGTTSPEGSVTAPVGSLYNQITAGGVFVQQWTKLTGAGNTGWA